MKAALFYGAVLIGAYLVLNHATGAGRLLGTATSGGSSLVKTFQGR